MKWIKQSLFFVAFSLPLCLELATIPGLPTQVQAQSYTALPSQQPTETWQISQAFKPPKRGAPPTSVGGATRGSSCLKGNKLLTPLMPKEKLGLTFAEHPTFFWYVPPSPVKTAQFVLMADADKKIFYETTFKLPPKPGIISFSLPANASSLEIGKRYHWYMTLICNDQNPSGNPSVDGWVERTQPESTLSQALAQAELRKRPALYAEAGIWHEALTTLVELRRTEPNNLKIKFDWRKFLQSVGLNAIAAEPLIDCCTTKN